MTSFNWTRVATQHRMRTHGTEQIEPNKKQKKRSKQPFYKPAKVKLPMVFEWDPQR